MSTRLTWDNTGERLYETGVDRGVLFPMDENGGYAAGVAWNGLTDVNESPSGAEPSPIYADNIKYLNLISAEELALTIQAYMYPPEFEPCNGATEVAPGVFIGQQTRKGFGFAYRTMVGNDVKGTDYGYKLHLVYGCKASPSEQSNTTVNENPEAKQLSWEVSTTPVTVENYKPTASLTIDSTKVEAAKLTALENILYGSTDADARLPLPAEVIALCGDAVEQESVE